MIKLTELLGLGQEPLLQLPQATPILLPIISQQDLEVTKLPVIPALILIDKSNTF